MLRPCRIRPCVTPLIIAVVSCWPFVRLDCTSRFRRALPRAMPDRSRGDMRARTPSETTPTTSDAAGQMKVGYRRLCYRAYDNPAFIWDARVDCNMRLAAQLATSCEDRALQLSSSISSTRARTVTGHLHLHFGHHFGLLFLFSSCVSVVGYPRRKSCQSVRQSVSGTP